MNAPFSLLRPLAAFVAAMTLAATSSVSHAAEKAAKSARQANLKESDAFLASSVVPHLEIEIPEKELNKLRQQAPAMARQGAEREDATITIREGGHVYTNVTAHLKGAAGSFRSVDDRPAFTLNFSKNAPGQTFHGLEKISLNNSVQDPTYLSEQFSRELFLKAGVPAPRAAHAKVTLNGKTLGLYVLVEGWNKQFLSRYFKNTKGNLYDGGFIKDVGDDIAVNSGDSPEDTSDRKALASAANESDPAVRADKLEKVLDIDRFLSFVAMDVLLWDWDGYPMNRNNWRVFHDLDSGKMVFMPHGLDQMLWNPEGPLLPRLEGMVARAVLGEPKFRKRYFDRIAELRKTVFQPESMTNRVREIAAKIQPAIKEAGEDAVKEHKNRVDGFCDAILRRCRNVDEQLSHPIEPVTFAADATARVKDWTSKSLFGKPAMDKITVDGVETLHLGASKGSSIGSWRTVVWLEPGVYQLETRVKARKIQPDPGDSKPGTGLRAGNDRNPSYITDADQWTPVSCKFSVHGTLSQMPLNCEFRGLSGEAWFDLNSMVLRKLPGQPEPEQRGPRRR